MMSREECVYIMDGKLKLFQKGLLEGGAMNSPSTNSKIDPIPDDVDMTPTPVITNKGKNGIPKEKYKKYQGIR